MKEYIAGVVPGQNTRPRLSEALQDPRDHAFGVASLVLAALKARSRVNQFGRY